MRLSEASSFRAVVGDVSGAMESPARDVVGSCVEVTRVERRRRAAPPGIFEVGVFWGERVNGGSGLDSAARDPGTTRSVAALIWIIMIQNAAVKNASILAFGRGSRVGKKTKELS